MGLVDEEKPVARCIEEAPELHHGVKEVVVVADDHIAPCAEVQPQLKGADGEPLGRSRQRRPGKTAVAAVQQRGQRVPHPVVVPLGVGTALRQAGGAALVVFTQAGLFLGCQGHAAQGQRGGGGPQAGEGVLGGGLRRVAGREVKQLFAAALAQSFQGREEGAHGLANAGGGLTKQPLAALAGTVDFPRQRPLPGAVRRKGKVQGLQALVPAGGPVQLPPCPRDVIPQQALEKGVQRGGGKVPGVPQDLVGVDLIIGQPDVQRVQRLLLCVDGSVDHALGPVAGAAVLPQFLGGEGGGLDLVDDGGAVLILKNAVGTALNGECDA